MRFAILDKDNLVVNIIEWNEYSQWKPPNDHTLLKIGDNDMAEPGGKYDSENFIRAPVFDIPISEVEKLKNILLDKKIITEDDIKVSLEERTLITKSSMFWLSLAIIASAIGIYYV